MLRDSLLMHYNIEIYANFILKIQRNHLLWKNQIWTLFLRLVVPRIWRNFKCLILPSIRVKH